MARAAVVAASGCGLGCAVAKCGTEEGNEVMELNTTQAPAKSPFACKKEKTENSEKSENFRGSKISERIGSGSPYAEGKENSEKVYKGISIFSDQIGYIVPFCRWHLRPHARAPFGVTWPRGRRIIRSRHTKPAKVAPSIQPNPALCPTVNTGTHHG